MTPLQQCELNLLKAFVQVCEKLGLRYYLVCGSALGAVKYRGFIPWDDDVDVAMPRADYERFLREAPALLPKDLVLQNYRTEPAVPHIYTKLRDSRTTYIERTSAKLPINHGIFIDIFPLDGYPQGKLTQKLFELRKWHYKGQLASAYDLPRSGVTLIRYKLFCLMGCPRRTDRIAAKYERMISRYPVEGSNLICNHGNWQGRLEYASAEQYGEGSAARFEGVDVVIPEGYDRYLRQKYGDYTLELPPEEQVGHHGYTVLDCQQPYSEYTSERRVN